MSSPMLRGTENLNSLESIYWSGSCILMQINSHSAFIEINGHIGMMLSEASHEMKFAVCAMLKRGRSDRDCTLHVIPLGKGSMQGLRWWGSLPVQFCACQ